MFKGFKLSTPYITFSFILLFVMGSASFSDNNMAVARDLTSQIEIFKALPEAKSLNTDNEMKLIDFYLPELEDQECIVFSKGKVCDINNAISGYLNNNGEPIGKSYGFLLSQINIAYHIAKDVPELSERGNLILQKIDKIYGPAVLQILYFSSCVNYYKNLLPNAILKNMESELIKLSKDNPTIKERAPYLFDIKYDKKSASSMLDEVETAVADNNMFLNLCDILCFHPKALICDSEFIIKNLSWDSSYDLDIDGKKHKFIIKFPRFWNIINKNENDPFTLFHLISPLDNLNATYRSYAYFEGVSGATPKEFYENLKKEDYYIKSILNDPDITINKISIEKLGYEDVMVIEYQNPSMKDKSGLYRTCRCYIFLLDKKTIVFNYSVGAVYKNDCIKAMERNIPLFEKLVKSSLDSFYNE